MKKAKGPPPPADLDAWRLRRQWRDSRENGAKAPGVPTPLGTSSVVAVPRLMHGNVVVATLPKPYPARIHVSTKLKKPLKCAVCGGVWVQNQRESHREWCIVPFNRVVRGAQTSLEWGSKPDQILVRRSCIPPVQKMRGAKKRRNWGKPPS